jgi:hypothetical protein
MNPNLTRYIVIIQPACGWFETRGLNSTSIAMKISLLNTTVRHELLSIKGKQTGRKTLEGVEDPKKEMRNRRTYVLKKPSFPFSSSTGHQRVHTPVHFVPIVTLWLQQI